MIKLFLMLTLSGVSIIIIRNSNMRIPITPIFAICFTASLIFSGCKSEQKLIESAAIGYLTAMGNYEIKEAEKYATEETIENTLHFIEERIMPNLDSTYIRQNTPASFEITEVNLTNDTTAAVKYVKTTPIQVQEGTLDMVKRNNQWKAKVLIQIPDVLKIEHSVDSKALDEKYKGKVKRVKPGEAPNSNNN